MFLNFLIVYKIIPCQEKLHLNCIFILKNGIDDDNLGKDKIAKLLTSVWPVRHLLSMWRNSLNSCHAPSMFLEYLTHKCIIGRMCQRKFVLFRSQQNSMKRWCLCHSIIYCVQIIIPYEQSKQLAGVMAVTEPIWKSNTIIVPSCWIFTL